MQNPRLQLQQTKTIEDEYGLMLSWVQAIKERLQELGESALDESSADSHVKLETALNYLATARDARRLEAALEDHLEESKI